MKGGRRERRKGVSEERKKTGKRDERRKKKKGRKEGRKEARERPLDCDFGAVGICSWAASGERREGRKEGAKQGRAGITRPIFQPLLSTFFLPSLLKKKEG